MSVPGFLYKPLMESLLGATLGKMACGIKVINGQGQRLGLFYAYARAFPFLLAAGVALASQLALYSAPGFDSAKTLADMAQVKTSGYWHAVNTLVTLLILVDCIVVAFTPRKRALHDLLADSYCVYKEP